MVLRIGNKLAICVGSDLRCTVARLRGSASTTVREGPEGTAVRDSFRIVRPGLKWPQQVRGDGNSFECHVYVQHIYRQAEAWHFTSIPLP